MPTVFSHIVLNMLSQDYENVATESLSFILQNSEHARLGMTKLLRGVVPDMPVLFFRTQQGERLEDRDFRPDMMGVNEREVRAYIENKFEAGLTDNQPNTYIAQLASIPKSTILLVVVPEDRIEMMWGELNRRLSAAGTAISADMPTENIVHAAKTSVGPFLAITSWNRLLFRLEAESSEDLGAKSDLNQLRALCDAADRDAFIPFAEVMVSDQRTPALLLQVNAIVQAAIGKGQNEGSLNLDKLRSAASWDRIGQWANVGDRNDVGYFLGLNLKLWKIFGQTPLWLVFTNSTWGRAGEVRKFIEPFAAEKCITTKFLDNEFVIAIDMPVKKEKDAVVQAVAERLKWVSTCLADLPKVEKT
jgi:hypothetical protein